MHALTDITQFFIEDADELIRTVIPFVNMSLLITLAFLIAKLGHRVAKIEKHSHHDEQR